MVAAADREAVEVAWRSSKSAPIPPPWPECSPRVSVTGWAVGVGRWRGSAPHQPRGRPSVAYALFAPNLVQRLGDGRHVALDAGPLFDWARAAGSVYQNQLQRALTTKLGVRWGRTATTPGRWKASAKPSCGPSPSAAPRSKPSSKPKGRTTNRRPCACGPMTRRRYPPGRPRTARLPPAFWPGAGSSKRHRWGWPPGPTWTGRCARTVES